MARWVLGAVVACPNSKDLRTMLETMNMPGNYVDDLRGATNRPCRHDR